MFEKDAQIIVDKLEPSDGWWSIDTENALYDAAMIMLVHGLSNYHVETTLSCIVTAIRNEYGD